MNKYILFAIGVLIFYFVQEQFAPTQQSPEPAALVNNTPSGAAQSFRNGAQTQGSGVVIRILADDDDGSRHQRFIIRLDSGRTLLIAHNIDVASRIASLREGDTVAFNGVFESNDKGGLIHWTHRDPQGRHEAGWLQHEGRTYQ